MFFTEVFVELQLPKVGQQLNSSALHHVLTEVHHAVEVVVMSSLGVLVTFSVHCHHKNKQIEIFYILKMITSQSFWM